MVLDDASLSGVGYARVDSRATCVVTRFQPRSVVDLIRPAAVGENLNWDEVDRRPLAASP